MLPEQVIQSSNQFKKGAVFLLRFWAGMPDSTIDSIIDDVVQVAWCRYLENPTDDLFKVGKVAAQEYVRKNGAFYLRTQKMSDAENEPAPPRTSRDPLPTDISAALMNEFYAQRRPSGPKLNAETRSGGQRRLEAAARDTLIVDLLWQGYSDEGIAMELGSTYYSIRTYRRQIKKRLHHMQTQQEQSQSQYCPAWQ